MKQQQKKKKEGAHVSDSCFIGTPPSIKPAQHTSALVAQICIKFFMNTHTYPITHTLTLNSHALYTCLSADCYQPRTSSPLQDDAGAFSNMFASVSFIDLFYLPTTSRTEKGPKFSFSNTF